ncbi:MAG: (Fe-S)-binding protein [Desulfamplus sp.]|nr:(Fe-S)-binding protein [Desulfamplus sp.]
MIESNKISEIKDKDTETDDQGILTGVRNLTPERIENVIGQVLGDETGARLKVYVDTCVHCGMCSDGCHFFLSKDRNPRYSPAGKVKQTMWEIIRKNGRVSPDFIKSAAVVAYTQCNLCKRCAMYCPFGIDIAYVMSVMRRICHKLEVVPLYIQDTANSHSVSMNQMWVKDDEWVDTLMWQEEEAQEAIENLRIPLDKEGADIFYSVIGPEPKFRAQLIYQAAVIMNAAGENWTMPSMPGWDNSDMCMYTGDYEMMERLKRSHFECATKLRAKKIVMGECGHAFRSVYDMGNRALGWRMPPIEVIHSIEYFSDLLDGNRLKLKKKFERPVTLHDPCNVIRGRGLHEMSRNIVRNTCETFIEMTPNREHNYCCSAGGGVINCGPPFKNARVESGRIKAEQLLAAKAQGAEVVISPCHNCHGGLEDTIHHYNIGMDLKFFGDIIYEIMELPGQQ